MATNLKIHLSDEGGEEKIQRRGCGEKSLLVWVTIMIG